MKKYISDVTQCNSENINTHFTHTHTKKNIHINVTLIVELAKYHFKH